jgi:hypothetical protein
MSKDKCVVLDHSKDHKLYTLQDDLTQQVYTNIPHIYVSSSRLPYEWGDYFKVGTIVKFTGVNGKLAEIVDIRHDDEFEAVVDLKELSTGFLKFSARPSAFYLDISYYRDW